MITVEHLTKRFGGFTAVSDLSFQLQRGEVVGFLGPNGAGKTTTMRMLTGFLPATSGRVEIAGCDVLRQSMEVRKHIGYLPEAVPLYKEHRIEELLTFQGRLHRMSRSEIKRRTAEVLERVGLADRSRSLFGKLSKGQRQRVGIAVALLHAPDVLILDEPTSGLDPLQRIQVRQLITELADEHTVLISSHILPEIEAVCSRVLILSQGRIAAQGTREELLGQHGDSSFVRLEAVVGPDTDAAVRLLKTIPEVNEVQHEGRLGIHEVFRIPCEQDVREEVGAIAAAKSWALRELSWQKPSLETIFSRIALGLDADGASESSGAAASSPGQPEATEIAVNLGGAGSSAGQEQPVDSGLMSLGTAAGPASAPAKVSGSHLSPFEQQQPKIKPKLKSKQVYNLNPFEQGGQEAGGGEAGLRDLGAPKKVVLREKAMPFHPAKPKSPKSSDGQPESGGSKSDSKAGKPSGDSKNTTKGDGA